jgi:hypothetical protein
MTKKKKKKKTALTCIALSRLHYEAAHFLLLRYGRLMKVAVQELVCIHMLQPDDVPIFQNSPGDMKFVQTQLKGGNMVILS